MKKEDRLKQIEKLWKSKKRDYPWRLAKWEILIDDYPFDLIQEKVAIDLGSKGYHFWKWGCRENTSGILTWDQALLHQLHLWYCLPEDCDTPIFINEAARAVCIPHERWVKDLTQLFQPPSSVLLGMDDWDARMEREETARLQAYGN